MMGPPILFLVNDQRPVLDALSDDLARRLGVEYRIPQRTLPDGGASEPSSDSPISRRRLLWSSRHSGWTR
jgi:hypothetical protein